MWEEKCCLLFYDDKRYLSQFVSEIFDSLQQDSTKSAPQYELNSFVTMARYWVPGLPNIKGIFGHLWHCILIFANGASYASSSKHIDMQDSTKSAPQYELNSFVTMARYWVPGLPNIKGIFGHLWHCILIFVNGASYASSSKHIDMLAQVCGLGLMFCVLKIN